MKALKFKTLSTPRYFIVAVVVVAVIICGVTTSSWMHSSDSAELDAWRAQLDSQTQQGGEPSSVSSLGQSTPIHLERVEETEELLRTWNAGYHSRTKSRLQKGVTSNIHIFFTIDCTRHSLWQALMLERSWLKVKHIGAITRIVSGCLPNQRKAELLNRTLIPADEDRYGIFYSPTFNVLPDGTVYAPYNRPNAFWYWINHTVLPETVLINIDPDMVFLKPLQFPTVSKGKPVAQDYDYMHDMDFTDFYTEYCPKCPTLTKAKLIHFAVGPPWMLHTEDWRTLLATWVHMIPVMRNKATGNYKWIVEMVAFAAAAAVHQLPFRRIVDGMVHSAEGPFWNPHTRKVIPTSKAFDVVPSLLHYCYTWEYGGPSPKNGEEAREQHTRIASEDAHGKPSIKYWHFSKYRVPTDWPGGSGQYKHDVMACDGPLLQELPEPFERFVTKYVEEDHQRHAFMMHILLKEINEVLIEYREKYCSDDGGRYKESPDARQLRTTHHSYYLSSVSNLSLIMH
eukprot:PhF_6_TR30170/c0_g1_i3/m.44259